MANERYIDQRAQFIGTVSSDPYDRAQAITNYVTYINTLDGRYRLSEFKLAMVFAGGIGIVGNVEHDVLRAGTYITILDAMVRAERIGGFSASGEVKNYVHGIFDMTGSLVRRLHQGDLTKRLDEVRHQFNARATRRATERMPVVRVK